MKIVLFAWLLVVLSGEYCSKNKNGGIPSCVLNKIEQIKAKPRWNPPAEVTEYEYEGREVYLFTSDCCDQFIELFDSNCKYICAPSGGIAGNGDGKCTDFYSRATFIRVAWKDSR